MASLLAPLASLGAHLAVFVHGRVLRAFLGTQMTGLFAGGDRRHEHDVVTAGSAGSQCTGGGAEVGAVGARSDALDEILDGVFAEAGVGAGRTDLRAVVTLLDAADQCRVSAALDSRVGTENLLGVHGGRSGIWEVYLLNLPEAGWFRIGRKLRTSFPRGATIRVDIEFGRARRSSREAMSMKFATFTSDPAVCQAARAHWRQLIANLPCRPMEHGWADWGKKVHVDESGADIYSTKNDEARRGVMLVQCVEINNRVQATAWTAWYGGNAGDPEAMPYIKINVVHTDETERMAVALLTRFVCDGASLEQMDAMIREMGLNEEPRRS